MKQQIAMPLISTTRIVLAKSKSIRTSNIKIRQQVVNRLEISFADNVSY